MSTSSPNNLRNVATVENRSETVAGWFLSIVAAGLLVLVGLPGGVQGVLAGVAGGLALLVAWYALDPPYAFSVGIIALAATVGARPFETIAAVTAAILLLLLVVPDATTSRNRRRALAAIGFMVVLAVVAWSAQTAWDATWATAGVLAGIATLIAYGLHRYEQVQLGVPTRE